MGTTVERQGGARTGQLHLACVASLDDERASRALERKKAPCSVGWAWDTWEAAGYARRYTQSTVHSYRWACTLAAMEWPCSTPTPGQVEVWMHKLTACGRSQGTANMYLRCVKAVTNTAARMVSTHAAHTLADAFASARPFREPMRKPRCPKKEVFMQALAACENPAEVAFLRLCSVGSLRVGEVLALRPEDFDADKWTLRVHATRYKGKPTDRRKNRDDHVCVLDDATATALVWTLTHAELVRSKSGRFTPEGGNGRGCIFPWARCRVANFLRRLRVAAPELTSWHALRHLGGSAVYDLTGSISRVQEHLGDRTATVAMCYAQPLRAEKTCDMQTVTDYLSTRDADVTAPAPRVTSRDKLVHNNSIEVTMCHAISTQLPSVKGKSR